jgi:hypothetical protein
LPNIKGSEEKKEASTEEGVRNTPNNKEKVKIGLTILFTILLRVFIKQTKYREISFLTSFYIEK